MASTMSEDDGKSLRESPGPNFSENPKGFKNRDVSITSTGQAHYWDNASGFKMTTVTINTGVAATSRDIIPGHGQPQPPRQSKLKLLAGGPEGGPYSRQIPSAQTAFPRLLSGKHKHASIEPNTEPDSTEQHAPNVYIPPELLPVVYSILSTIRSSISPFIVAQNGTS